MRAMAVAALLSACGGKEKVPIQAYPNDPSPASWLDPHGYGLLDVATGEAVGEAEEPRCQVRAQFAVAESDGESERTMWKNQCALYPDLEMEGEAGLRPAGGGVVVFGLGATSRNVTAPPEWNPPVVLDCLAELAGPLVSARSADAEDGDDEAPEFSLDVERPDPVVIDAPFAVPVARFEAQGSLEVRWSGGEPGRGIEILLESRAAEDDGDGLVRCWTADDGTHAIDSSLVDLFRDQPSTVTVSRVNIVVPPEPEGTEGDTGWSIRLAWWESTSRFVLNAGE